MLDMFSFKCCQDVTQDDLEFDLEIKNTLTNPRGLDTELKKLKNLLKTKLCLFIIYSNTTDLLPFNELKNDEQSNLILNKKYFETYKKTEDLISQTLIKTFSFPKFSVITFILSLDKDDDNFKLYDYLKDEEVTRHNIKKLLKIYQYMMYNPPPEPDENDQNCCNIIFRFIDESMSFCRKFDKNTKIQEFYHLISSKYPKMPYRLFKTSPSSELIELNNTLEQERLWPSGLIQVVS
jgi:hypothetical protein